MATNDYRTTIPSELTIGESVNVNKSFSDYSAATWTLTYYFRGAGPGFNVIATADGTDFVVAILASATADMLAGQYYYDAFVTSGVQKIRVDSGKLTALENLTAIPADASYDPRSKIKLTLDNLDAMISGKATADVQEYSIGSRQLKRYPMKDLIELRKEYARLYAAELRQEKRKKGGDLFTNHYAKFNEPR